MKTMACRRPRKGRVSGVEGWLPKPSTSARPAAPAISRPGECQADADLLGQSGRLAVIERFLDKEEGAGKQDAETQQNDQHLQHPYARRGFQAHNARKQADEGDDDPQRADGDADLAIALHAPSLSGRQSGPQGCARNSHPGSPLHQPTCSPAPSAPDQWSTGRRMSRIQGAGSCPKAAVEVAANADMAGAAGDLADVINCGDHLLHGSGIFAVAGRQSGSRNRLYGMIPTAPSRSAMRRIRSSERLRSGRSGRKRSGLAWLAKSGPS
ncbi:MAG: hypothetical protein KatS3mg051_0278 [Anaerolineae bacterium]|nr:MAG: hypothetical protein KatS3mg051_0278 [Anaerolineae bacterium]